MSILSKNKVERFGEYVLIAAFFLTIGDYLFGQQLKDYIPHKYAQIVETVSSVGQYLKYDKPPGYTQIVQVESTYSTLLKQRNLHSDLAKVAEILFLRPETDEKLLMSNSLDARVVKVSDNPSKDFMFKKVPVVISAPRKVESF